MQVQLEFHLVVKKNSPDQILYHNRHKCHNRCVTQKGLGLQNFRRTWPRSLNIFVTSREKEIEHEHENTTIEVLTNNWSSVNYQFHYYAKYNVFFFPIAPV